MPPTKVSFWRILVDQGAVNTTILNYEYEGKGTEEDPYAVTWIPDDFRDPQLFSTVRKISITLVAAFSSLIVSLSSSAYSGSVKELIIAFNVSSQVATLGLSLYVLGFAIGPLLWGPFSEVLGRQISFIISLLLMAVFLAASAGAQNIWSLCIFRFFAGAFGSAPLTNGGGTISDLFTARERGLGIGLYSAAPFLGPTLGPIIGGFLGMKGSWRLVEGLLAILSGVVWLLCSLVIPETYAPVLLRRRAVRLSRLSGKIFQSKIDISRISDQKRQGNVTGQKGHESLVHLLRVTISRPMVLLVREPIITLCSVYVAIVYGTLYMLFAAFPLVFEDVRGWNPGIGGLSFIGVMIGMIIGLTFSMLANFHYAKIQDRHGGYAPPEARLLPCIPGALAIPISQFWFAWTNYPSIHWSVCIIGTAPFGFGVILIYLGIMNYLIDSYTIYATSALAANCVLRSIFGAIFPVIAIYMYDGIGIHWAPSIPAFVSLLCVPVPLLFYRYGESIRKSCKYSAESCSYMEDLMEKRTQERPNETKPGEPLTGPVDAPERERAVTRK